MVSGGAVGARPTPTTRSGGRGRRRPAPVVAVACDPAVGAAPPWALPRTSVGRSPCAACPGRAPVRRDNYRNRYGWRAGWAARYRRGRGGALSVDGGEDDQPVIPYGGADGVAYGESSDVTLAFAVGGVSITVNYNCS